MMSDLVVFDTTCKEISLTCNFYPCFFAMVLFYGFVHTYSKFKQLRIEHVDQLPAELAHLRQGTDDVITQLYDEVARVRVGNHDVIRKLKEEINDLHVDDDKFVVELRNHFTQQCQKNDTNENIMHTLEAEFRENVIQLTHQNENAEKKVCDIQSENLKFYHQFKEELIQRKIEQDKIVQELYVLSEQTVRSIRFTVTQLNQKNDNTVSIVQTLYVKMRALEVELDTQRQKHVELSDYARGAYIQPHAAVVAAIAKEERTRGNAAVMAEVVRLSQESVECKVSVANEVVVTDQVFHESHPVVPLIIVSSVTNMQFLDCTTCLIVTSFRVFKNDRQQLDDALVYICEIADEPVDALGIYRLFLKELFSAIDYYERPGYCATQALGDICNRGFNFNELLFWIHLNDCGNTRNRRLERKMRKVFRYLRLKANPPYGIPAEFTENRRLNEYCIGGLGGGPLNRF